MHLTFTGPASTHGFTHFEQEKGRVYGFNDIVKGDSDVDNEEKVPKLYLHIPRNIWSSCTLILREYLLPWRWKAIYLDIYGISTRVLVSGNDLESAGRLPEFINQTLLTTHLLSRFTYEEVLGQEYLLVDDDDFYKHERVRDFGTGWIGITPKEPTYELVKFIHRFGEKFGSEERKTSDHYYSFFSKRNFFSWLQYEYLKRYSDLHKEVTLTVRSFEQKILILKKDEEFLNRSSKFNIS